MKIIINSSSMVPIYEQIEDQVKAQIIIGELKEDDNLPSVRTLNKGGTYENYNQQFIDGTDL